MQICNIIDKVKNTIIRYDMVERGDRVIVAVSGGPDSVCLLDILYAIREDLGIDMVVAHYDHGLRPGDDESETAFVRQLALSMNLPFELGKAQPFPSNTGHSLEEQARDARYGFLESTRKKHHAQKIALGHQLNDQAETVIMRLLRGSGSSGLAGIPPVRDKRIIRPLIEIKRHEIAAYLNVRGLEYVVDRSNLQGRYLRNKIRLEMIPELLKYQPRLLELLGQTSEILRDESRYFDQIAEAWVNREAEYPPDGDIAIELSSLLNLHKALQRRVIRALLSKKGRTLRRIDRGHIDSVIQLIKGQRPQGQLHLPNGLILKKTYDRLTLGTYSKPKKKHFHYSLDGPGTFHLHAINRHVTLVEIAPGGSWDLGISRRTAFFDAEKIRYPLILRNVKPGDRFVPLGMSGHKKIKDFFMDLKIPSEMRSSIPILISHHQVLWVCGYRIDDRFKVTEGSKRILQVSLH